MRKNYRIVLVEHKGGIQHMEQKDLDVLGLQTDPAWYIHLSLGGVPFSSIQFF